jgi:hypothetical protein
MDRIVNTLTGTENRIEFPKGSDVVAVVYDSVKDQLTVYAPCGDHVGACLLHSGINTLLEIALERHMMDKKVCNEIAFPENATILG